MGSKRANGDGSIYRRGNRWAATFTGRDGRRHYLGGTFATKRDARNALQEALLKDRGGAFVARDKVTFEQYAEDTFFPNERPRLAPSTHDRYRLGIKAHVLPRIGSTPLQDVTTAQLDRLWAEMLAGEHRRPVSERTVEIIRGIVKRIFDDALREGLVVRHPIVPGHRHDRKGRSKRPEITAWTLDQVYALLDHVRDTEGFGGSEVQVRTCRTCEATVPASMFSREPNGRDGLKPDCRDCVNAARREKGERPSAKPRMRLDDLPLYAMIHVVATTGMRRGEVCGLRWKDVDLDAGVLHVRQQYRNEGGYRWGVGPLKTERARRVVPIDDETASVLRIHRARQQQLRLVLGASHANPLDLAFTRATGEPVPPDMLGKRFSALAKASGIPPITQRQGRPSWTLHGLRHSVATILAPKDLAGTSAMLGHHDPNFTAAQYVHPTTGSVRELQGRLQRPSGKPALRVVN